MRINDRILFFCAVMLFLPVLSSGQWVQTGGPCGGLVESFAASGKFVLVTGNGGGVFRSTDNGKTWMPSNDGLTNTNAGPILVNGTDVYVGTLTGGVFRSTDDGNRWEAVNNGLTDKYVRALAVSGSTLFAGTASRGVFRSTNEGKSWTRINSGLADTSLTSLAANGPIIFAGTAGHGIYRSTNYGASWAEANSGITGNGYLPQEIIVNPPGGGAGANVFAGTYGGLYRSTNQGVSWFKTTDASVNAGVYGLSFVGSNLYVAVPWPDAGVFASTDNGVSWKVLNTGLTNRMVFSVYGTANALFAGTPSGAFRSTDAGLHWAVANTGLINLGVRALCASGTTLYAGSDKGGVFRSTNNGSTWTHAASGLTDSTVRVIVMRGSTLYAGTYYKGIFRSTDDGATWGPVSKGLPALTVRTLALSGSNILAGTDGGAIYSTNGGDSWAAAGGLSSIGVTHIAVNGPTAWAVTSGANASLYSSTNDGVSWSFRISVGRPSASIAIVKNEVYVGTYGGGVLWLRTSYWTPVNSGLPVFNISELAASGNNLFAGTDSGIYLSSNSGGTWRSVWDGLKIPIVAELSVNGSDLFAGTLSGGVWRRPLSQMITSVGSEPPELPGSFELSQNYPNPFNPATNISFTVSTAGFVSLKVYDLLGREIAVLVNERKSPGEHTVRFNAGSGYPGGSLSSGVYIYRMVAGGNSESKKMVLVQ